MIRIDENAGYGNTTTAYAEVQIARVSDTVSLAVFTNGEEFGVASIDMSTYRGQQNVWRGMAAGMTEADARELANAIYTAKRARRA